MDDRKKRELRKLKRDIKQAGNKKRRGNLKRDLRENPEEAHHSEERFGRFRSDAFNGLDQDATRQRDATDQDPDSEQPAN